jgi:hypothetical protein
MSTQTRTAAVYEPFIRGWLNYPRLAPAGPGHASEMAEPKDEIQQLLNYLLPYAEEMLSKDGEFYPCAATMDAGGEVLAVSAASGERPDVGELLLALHAELREQAAGGAIRASGIAADVTLTDPDSGETTDAVQLELDHADAEAVDVYVPYETDPEGIKFGELVAAAGRTPIFDG